MSSTLHYKVIQKHIRFILSLGSEKPIHRRPERRILMLNYTDHVTDLGKMLVVLGAIVVVAGLVLILLGKTSLPLGRLPGDIYYRGKNATFYFPLATSLLVSVALSLLLYVISRFRR